MRLGVHPKAFALATGFAASAAAIALFQNFSPGTAVATVPQARVIMPIKTGSTVVDTTPDDPQCNDYDRRVIYLRLPEVAVGIELRGLVRDIATGMEISVSVVSGQGASADFCEDSSFDKAGRLKICFRSAATEYPSFKVELKSSSGDIHIEQTVLATRYCESDSKWISAEVGNGSSGMTSTSKTAEGVSL